MLRGRNVKQAYILSGSLAMPSASPRLGFSGSFKVFVPRARWFIIIGTLYNSLVFSKCFTVIFLSLLCTMPSHSTTIIGFGGGSACFPREKKMPVLIWGTFWGFTFVSPSLFFFWSHPLQPLVTFGFFVPTQTCPRFPPLCPQIPHSPRVRTSPPAQPAPALTSGPQVLQSQPALCPWEAGVALMHHLHLQLHRWALKGPESGGEAAAESVIPSVGRSSEVEPSDVVLSVGQE